MIFSNEKAIYMQMADRLCDEIIAGKYKDDDRVPSVREYSAMLEVNMNTSFKAYEMLARKGIIYNKRGLGYFVTAHAAQQIKSERRDEFLKRKLPELFRQMKMLDLGIEKVDELWSKYKDNATDDDNV